jgi:hypothetical protein
VLAAIHSHIWVIYPCLIIAAAYLNRNNLNSLKLLFIVAASFYLPVKVIENYYLWYAVVICTELLVITLSMRLKCYASLLVTCVTALLTLSHVTSLFADNIVLYSIIAKYLEHLQMLTFIVASPLIINKLKRKMRCLM